VRVKSFAITDVGLRRSHNEDSHIADDELKIYLVADGMGGHVAGEVASQTAARTVEDFVRRAENDLEMTWPFRPRDSLSATENTLLSAIKLANLMICRMASEKPEMSGMGTTIAGVKIEDSGASIFNVGDSRVYRVRQGVMSQLTTDHSWVSEQLQRQMITEEEARTHRWKNVITRALGNKATIEVDLQTTTMEDGDMLLICTDGLSGLVSDEVMLETLSAHNDDLEQAAKDLVAQANAAGGHDNITVILVQCLAD
jgi:protein phosphatase